MIQNFGCGESTVNFFLFWQHFFFRWQNICEQVRLRHVYSVFTYSVKFSHILSRFSIISIEIWASSLIRKNSLIVYKFHCLCTSASCSHLGIVPYFFPAPALKLLFQKKKSVLINSYIYTIHNSSSSSWQTICEQVQNYLRCQDHFSSTFSVVGHGISENPP